MSKPSSDITGKKFGRLTALQFSHKNKHGMHYWLCECTCGTKLPIRKQNLTGKITISCGCYNKEVNQDDPTNRINGAIKKGKYSKQLPPGKAFKQMCDEYGILEKVVRRRLKRGWGIKKAFETPVDQDKAIMLKANKAKGTKLEDYIVEQIGAHFPELEKDTDYRRVASSRSGVDIILSAKAQKLFPVSVECKNTADFESNHIDQSKRNAYPNTLPIVAWHETGTKFANTQVICEFDDFIKFIKGIIKE